MSSAHHVTKRLHHRSSGRKANPAALQSYLETALWSSTDPETDEPLDQNYSVSDFSRESRSAALRDVASFMSHHHADLAASGLSPERIGHDFWLSRNGHGAGFFDEGLGALGDRLQKAAKVYGSVDLYAHRGKIHGT
jgi:hypothetical protein